MKKKYSCLTPSDDWDFWGYYQLYQGFWFQMGAHCQTYQGLGKNHLPKAKITIPRQNSRPEGKNHLLKANITSPRQKSPPQGKNRLPKAKITSPRHKCPPQGKMRLLKSKSTCPRRRSHPQGKNDLLKATNLAQMQLPKFGKIFPIQGLISPIKH